MRNKPESRIQPVSTASPFYENQKQKIYDESESMNYASPRAQEPNNPVPRSNLITVPLQEPAQDYNYPSYNSGYYPPSYQDYPPPQTDTSVPPPQQWTNNQQFYG